MSNGTYIDNLGDIRVDYSAPRRRGAAPGMCTVLSALSGLSRSHISNVSKGRTRSVRIEAMIEDYKAGKLNGLNPGRASR